MTTWITVCDTCKSPDWDAESGRTDGAALADLVEDAAQGAAGVRVRRHSCLMGCKHACNVAVQAPGKLAYTLGRFAPAAEDAAGIVEYAVLHAQSETGQVPFRQWPPAIKGHFITRHPPVPSA